MGILYLAAHVRSTLDAEVRLVNQRLANLPNDRLVEEAADFGADVVGFSAMTPTAHRLPYLTRAVRQALPNALILLGGPHVSSLQTLALADTVADAAVPGEGERALEMILRAHVEGGRLADVPGIYWRDRDGEVVANPGCLPPIEDLDTLPFPAYDLIDLPAYWRRQGIAPIPRRRYASLFSSRGCPYRCSYCHDVFGKRFRPHSAERVVDEIERCRREYGVEEVEFLDDAFNARPKRVIEVCDLIRRRGLRVALSFPSGLRTDILDEDTIDALVDAGTYFSSFALESGSPRIQEVMGKKLDIARFVENVAYAVSRGIFANGFAMFGFPTETEEDMQQTIDVACQSRLHTMSFFTVTPFPGTDLFASIQETHGDLLARIKYDDINFGNVTLNFSAVSDAKLFRYQRAANRRFFLNPVRIARILRDYPKPQLLPLYVPIFAKRVTNGLFAQS